MAKTSKAQQASEHVGIPALNGVKVIDLTRVLGGPYATQILADHGAEVIKVESHEGDEVRGWGPPFANDMASYFINVNRNKKSIIIDLASVKGRAVLLRLLEDADVLIDNFKTGTLEKWGIGYHDVLAERFPRLIHCRISGFGEDGPLGGAPGYDAVIQAMTGLMSINGMAEAGAVRLGTPIVDMGTGLSIIEQLIFFWLKPSVAEANILTPSTPASIARSSPFKFGTST